MPIPNREASNKGRALPALVLPAWGKAGSAISWAKLVSATSQEGRNVQLVIADKLGELQLDLGA